MPNRPRLYVPARLARGESIVLRRDQNSYLRRVMRKKDHAHVCLFNGRDGEWLARTGAWFDAPLQVEEQVSPLVPTRGPEVWFSPLRPARTACLVEKATEMGAQALRPVTTQRSRPGSVNLERLQRICEEAGEQTGRHDVPVVHGPIPLLEALSRPGSMAFCDEKQPGVGFSRPAGAADIILIGPEGGFTDEERSVILARGCTLPVGLGNRVLRAETACVVALALWYRVGGNRQ